MGVGIDVGVGEAVKVGEGGGVPVAVGAGVGVATLSQAARIKVDTRIKNKMENVFIIYLFPAGLIPGVLHVFHQLK